jgi:CRP/FNR family cyclic AMP-dependent transcriptional regulator
VRDVHVDDLRRTPLFAGLGRRELGRLASTMTEREFEAGAAIAIEGEVGVGFFVIETGEAIVTLAGKEVTRLGPGDHFGEIALIAETDRTATVTAATDLRCYAMTSWEFRRLVESNATVAWKLLQAMARRLVDLGQTKLEQSAGA